MSDKVEAHAVCLLDYRVKMLIENWSLLQNHSVVFAKLCYKNCSFMRETLSCWCFWGVFFVSSLKKTLRVSCKIDVSERDKKN